MLKPTEKQTFDQIKCPACGELIPITETLRHQLTEQARDELKQEVLEQQKVLAKKEKALEEKEIHLTDAQNNVEKEIKSRLKAETAKLEPEFIKKAEAKFQLDLKEMREAAAEKDKKLEVAEAAELQLRKEKRQLESDKRAFELEMTRRLDADREQIREEAQKSASEAHRLKSAEMEKKLQDALGVNDELRRKLQQGSQQTQGEVMELELEAFLRLNFPLDDVQPVSKGIRGADVIQKVFDRAGNFCGSIIWESKRTKNWSEGWIEKLKDDQREAKADVAVLVSEVLPKEIRGFACRDGIWISSLGLILGLASVLRDTLVQIAVSKLATVGKNEKMEVLYGYLTGAQFRHRVEAVIETFNAMQQDLEEEKRVYARRWAKREKQIERVVANTSGMYGDLQGLIGSAMGSIPALESQDKLLDSSDSAAHVEGTDEGDIPF